METLVQTPAVNTTDTQVATLSDVIIPKDLAAIEQAVRQDINAIPTYWSPEAEGEVKRAVFLKVIPEMDIPDFNDPEGTVKKDCVLLLEYKDGKGQLIICAASRLVSFFRHHGQAQRSYEIVFVGRQKNKTNSNASNHFEVYLLVEA